MPLNTLRIATRKSPLAVWQAEHVADLLTVQNPDLSIELVKMVTKGDKILDAPLAKVGGKGLFVKELEQGLINGDADIAVHSMKDVPMAFPEGLGLSVVMQRHDPTDALVSNHYDSLDALPENAVVGTSSLRRSLQLKRRYPGFQIKSLRGNIQTRMGKLDNGEYDAIVLASSGLKRMGYDERIRQILPPEVSLPSVGQGALGIETRIGDADVEALIRPLHNEATATRLAAERAMNTRLNGGCQVPIAGFALLDGDELWLRGLVGEPDGSVLYTAEARGPSNQAEQIGMQVAEDLLAQGADKVLAKMGLDYE